LKDDAKGFAGTFVVIYDHESASDDTGSIGEGGPRA
jgi:hypothetical protein